MNPICFYHKADLDGVCSAAIVKYFVPDCELYGIDHGEEFPWDKVRPGPDAENDPLWANLFRPENGYEEGTANILSVQLEGNPSVEFAPGQQSAPYEKITYQRRIVYMVDFSLPLEDMKRLAEVSNLVWIDHHGAAIDAFRAGMPCVKNWLARIDFAACELTWFFFACHENADLSQGAWESFTFDSRKLPEAVRLLGRYDIWAKDDPEWEAKILPFQYGCRTIRGIYHPENPFWKYQFQKAPDKDGTVWVNIREGVIVPNPEWLGLIGTGRAVLRYQAEVTRRACETGAHEFVWTIPDPELQPWTEPDKDGNQVLVQPLGMKFKLVDGKCERVPNNVMPSFRVIACNTIVFNSQFFDGFYDPEKHDVMCAYCRLKDGRWKVSLYSTKPEIDCGAIAKTFGGGGHFSAAGFVCDQLPWEK